MGQQMGEQETREALGQGALELFFEPGPGLFQEMGVGDAAGAGGLASEAAQAVIDVFHRICRGFYLPLEDALDQVDPSARPFQLVAGEHIGGAGGVAEATVDTGAQHLLGNLNAGIP